MGARLSSLRIFLFLRDAQSGASLSRTNGNDAAKMEILA